jgi:hypothetical protein
MSMCNHSSHRNWQLHERVNYLVLVGKVWTCGLRVIHFVMDDGQDMLPAASSACYTDHIKQSCLLDSLESIPRMTRSGFYLVHLLILCSGLVGHSQCSTLARNPSNAKMTEGILTQLSFQSLKLSSCEAYDQWSAQA